MNVETRHVRYVFADVERFTEDRTVDAQVEIVKALNESFRLSLGQLETIYLPTGDGICAGILDPAAPADIHLLAALDILDNFGKWASSKSYNRQAKIRIAINESVDAVTTDINGNRNLAGTGINTSQRLMSIADGNQIIAGHLTYETLRVHDQYANSFRRLKAEVKHGRILTAYQFVGEERPFLDTEIPMTVQLTNPIDLEVAEEFEKPGRWSTSGMIQVNQIAIERWTEEMELLLANLKPRCNGRQHEILNSSQNSWKAYYDAEVDFMAALRETVKGTMYGPIMSSTMKEMVRRRANSLTNYLEEWVGSGI